MMETITDIPAQLYVDPKRREELELVLEKDGLVQRFHCQLFRKDGSKIWLSTSARAIQQGDALVRDDGTFEDITERKLLEEQLRQAQKMEAVGRLAAEWRTTSTMRSASLSDTARF